jgi:hypothetical protein
MQLPEGYKHIIVMEFESEEALKKYADSPAQKQWYDVYMPIREESSHPDPHFSGADFKLTRPPRRSNRALRAVRSAFQIRPQAAPNSTQPAKQLRQADL